MKESKVGPYAMDPSSDPQKTNQLSKPGDQSKPANNPAKPINPNKSTKQRDNDHT